MSEACASNRKIGAVARGGKEAGVALKGGEADEGTISD